MKYIGFLFILTIIVMHVGAQSAPWKYLGKSTGNMDSTYISTYERLVTARVYYSRTNTGVRFTGADNHTFSYMPNNSKALGIGVSYRYVTVNIALGLLGRDPTKGRTHSFSLQPSLYKHQWMYDFVIQHYEGMYLTPQNVYSMSNSFYLRPDIATTLVGMDFWRIMNSDKFSYRAAMTQNDWQLKSAGSLLLGGEAHFGNIAGDSALTPQAIATDFPQNQVYRATSFYIGPGIGYAYNFVFKKNFYVSAGITENFDFIFGKEYARAPAVDKNVATISFNLNYRLAVGFNDKNWNISASMYNSSQTLKSYYSQDYRQFSQNYRITIARRINPGHKTRKIFLNDLDKGLNGVQDKVNKTVNGIVK